MPSVSPGLSAPLSVLSRPGIDLDWTRSFAAFSNSVVTQECPPWSLSTVPSTYIRYQGFTLWVSWSLA